MQEPIENTPLTTIVNLEDHRKIILTEPKSEEYFDSIKRFILSFDLRQGLNRFSRSLQNSAVIIDLLLAVAPGWAKKNGCSQPDGTNDFSKDIPKIIFLAALASYNSGHFTATKFFGTQKMKKFHLYESSFISTIAIGIFIQNMGPNLNLPFNPAWTMRLFQGLTALDWMSKTALTIKKPSEEILNKPEIAAPLNTLELSAGFAGDTALIYTTLFNALDLFYLPFLETDPANLQMILLGTSLALATISTATKFVPKLKDFNETHIAPNLSFVNLTALPIMSFIDCLKPISPEENPIQWLILTLTVIGIVEGLALFMTNSNARYNEFERTMDEMYPSLTATITAPQTSVSNLVSSDDEIIPSLN